MSDTPGDILKVWVVRSAETGVKAHFSSLEDGLSFLLEELEQRRFVTMWTKGMKRVHWEALPNYDDPEVGNGDAARGPLPPVPVWWIGLYPSDGGPPLRVEGVDRVAVEALYSQEGATLPESLNGRTASETTEQLEEVLPRLGGENSVQEIESLLRWAREHPSGVWHATPPYVVHVTAPCEPVSLPKHQPEEP